MSLLRIVAKYQSKKKLDTGTVVYEYSERQIADRHRKKAERYEKLSKSIEKLRKTVNKDLSAEDPKTSLTALAVALMDHTYERVGNDDSAEEGHFGVTGWKKSHISMGKGSATIKYVGKSGVKHEKKVTDSKILKALKKAYDGVEGKDNCIFDFEGGCVTAKDVNAYLKDFDITAKDIRGLHANQEMQDRLGKIRKAGPKLPEDKKKREKLLKDEFKEALEATAEAVGHEASTLRTQYLVPSLEEAYAKDGTVLKKLNEKSASDMCSPPAPLHFADRMIRQFLDHMIGSEVPVTDQDFQIMRTVFRNASGDWEKLLQGDPAQHTLLSNAVTAWVQSPGRKGV